MTTAEHQYAGKIYRVHVTFKETFGGNRKNVAKVLAKRCAESGGNPPEFTPGVEDVDVEIQDVASSVGSCGRDHNSRNRE